MKRMTDAEERNSIGEKAKNTGTKFSWTARGEEFKELLMRKLEKLK